MVTLESPPTMMVQEKNNIKNTVYTQFRGFGACASAETFSSEGGGFIDASDILLVSSPFSKKSMSVDLPLGCHVEIDCARRGRRAPLINSSRFRLRASQGTPLHHTCAGASAEPGKQIQKRRFTWTFLPLKPGAQMTLRGLEPRHTFTVDHTICQMVGLDHLPSVVLHEFELGACHPQELQRDAIDRSLV